MNAKKFYLPCLVMVGLLANIASPLQAAAIRTISGITANTLPANQDNSTGFVSIGFTVNFFGVNKSTLIVNNNGSVTFKSAESAFTPAAISASVTQPMIAPFYADVDTSGSGSGVVQYGKGTLCGRNVFGVNWINVGYFQSRVDKLNSFQLLLIDRSDTGAGNFDIEMNYDKIQWETGMLLQSKGVNGLGGNSAEVGYTNGLTGTSRVSYEFPGSRVNGALIDGGPNALISNSVASSTKGRYHFFVRNGVVIVPTGVVTVSTVDTLDISSSTKVFLPPNFVYHPSTNLYTGPIRMSRVGTAPVQSNATESCLDESYTTKAIVTPTPITIIFSKLPTGVTVANPTPSNKTTKGFTYYQFPSAATLEVGGTPLGLFISLRNPNRVNIYNSASYTFQVIEGTFDATQY